MASKEAWDGVKQEMIAEPLTLSSKMSYTTRYSLMGLEMILARYKFAAKMMKNRKKIRVLDFGCNDGLGTSLIAQECDCEKIVGIDFDEEAIGWAKNNIADAQLEFICGDFMKEAFVHGGEADFVVSLDVIEHIPVEEEKAYFIAIYQNLKTTGAAIIGTPNETMYKYASPWNKKAHINNYSQERLYEAMSQYFENVFIFGMNDEVLHTGMYPFACYIMALGCGKKRSGNE